MDLLIAEAEEQIDQEREIRRLRAHRAIDGDIAELRALVETALEALVSRGVHLVGWYAIHQFALTLLDQSERMIGRRAPWVVHRALRSEARKVWNAKKQTVRTQQLRALAQEVA